MSENFSTSLEAR